MPMNPNFLCCIGAELKNSTQQTTRMSQVYLYRAFEDQTLNDMLQSGFFDAAMGIIRKDDLLLLYSPNEASAKYTYARVSNVDRDGVEIESISIDAKNIIVDTDGFSVLDGGNLQEIIAQIDSLLPSDVSSLNKLIAESRLQSEITRRAVIKDSNVVQEMQSGLKTPSVEVDNSLTVNGSAEFDNAPTTNDTTTYQNATTDSLVRKEQVDEVIQDIKTSSLTFIGYVSATEPSSATYAFNTGDLWLNSATMPTTFPFPQANIKEWNGSAWVAHSQDYTPANFDFFRNVNNNEGYYWFGGEWVVMSTDMSTTYFQLNAVSGKWEIKSNVNLPGAPTTTTPSTDDNSTKIATTAFVKNALDEKGSGAGRNIGDTFMTKRTDTSLAGAVECDGATYNTTDFTGDGSIGELLEAGKLDYVSLSAYSTAISTKGWCDKIGWDGAGNTAFRVPTLNAHIVQTNNIPVVGNGIVLGVTDGTTYYGLLTSKNTVEHISGAPNLYGKNIGTQATDNLVGTGVPGIGITTDPTKSGIIADTTDTAQLRVMIQIADGATDEALETCTSVLADVADLKDMSNVTATGKATAVGWGIPDYTAGISFVSGYAIPKSGIIVCYTNVGSYRKLKLKINGITVYNEVPDVSGTNQRYYTPSFIVGSGDIITFEENITNGTFYPFKGVN